MQHDTPNQNPEPHNPYTTPQATTPPPGYDQAYAQTTEAKTSGLAIASLVLGILSILFGIFTVIPALICGHMARGKFKREPGQYKNQGLALAGLIIAYIMLAITLLAIINLLTTL